jgi:transcriptional regulator with XRE-family HTH domain
MPSLDLRTALGLTRSEWARALNVNERTVARWEDEAADPGGLTADVMRGIHNALEDGLDPKRAGRLVSLGVGSLIFYGLTGRKKL